ncbi:hypothetical protein AXF42_Ash011273 [Apostasia shenzhenica]|uniref:Uncharacterized protein n=1 Tax=Apostasia shenzhenica TaxID=1088818 RepID=A0A2I0AE12_9ASPA|nr:hypothetical protein AXF42_Ash011273 [Apostasia shenzhenica]
MEGRRRWKALSGLSKRRRAGSSPAGVLPAEKRRHAELPTEGAVAAEATVKMPREGEVRTPATIPTDTLPTKDADVLVEALEPVQGSTREEEMVAVVDVTDSPDRPSQMAEVRTEVSIVRQTSAGVSLKPGKILLKDENVEQFLPCVGITLTKEPVKTPLVICGPTFPEKLIPPLVVGIKEKKGAPQVVSKGMMSNRGNMLYEIRSEEEKVLKNTSEILEVIKNVKGREEGETRLFGKMVELEGAPLQAAERSQVCFNTELGELKKLEDRLASLASSSLEWAGPPEENKGVDDEKEALRWEREKFKKEAVDANEAESKAKQAAFEAHRENKLLKAEMHSMRALVKNNAGWRGRRMKDLEEAVRRAVNIVSASPVGHHVKSQAAFDLLFQTR